MLQFIRINARLRDREEPHDEGSDRAEGANQAGCERGRLHAGGILRLRQGCCDNYDTHVRS